MLDTKTIKDIKYNGRKLQLKDFDPKVIYRTIQYNEDIEDWIGWDIIEKVTDNETFNCFRMLYLSYNGNGTFIGYVSYDFKINDDYSITEDIHKCPVGITNAYFHSEDSIEDTDILFELAKRNKKQKEKHSVIL